ncbi:hypothetical protein [Azorhizobium caulinodans]|uniref:hypothetical protein n=1 Tax=Azorhizobium caulinodans TaxID=7 RepID=UPI002FBDC8C6
MMSQRFKRTSGAAAAGLALALLAAAPAEASSPDAWAELHARARAACIKASGLKEARALGQPVDFEASVLILVGGRWPQAHMNNARGTFACLYAKAGGTAEAQEITLPRP